MKKKVRVKPMFSLKSKALIIGAEREQKYEAGVLAAGEALVAEGRRGVFAMTIRHDNWCPMLKDPPGDCTCEPEIDPLPSGN